MKSRSTSIVSAVLAICTAFFLLGLSSATAQKADIEPLDRAALSQMSKEERFEAQRAYKQRLESAARAAGWEPSERRAFQPSGGVVAAPSANRVPGTSITYHSGALGTCCQNSFSVGNRYDTALNVAATATAPVEMSGSITGATFTMAAVGGSAAFFSVFDQLNTGAGSANVVTSALQTGLAAGANTVNFASPINYVGSSFLAGIWQFTAGTDTPNVATGTVGGQGFHGMSINDIAGTAYNPSTTFNGALTINGNVATPVELQHFSVE